MKMKEESKIFGLKLNIKKTMIMISGLITAQQMDGETMEISIHFILGAPKLLQIATAAMNFKSTYWMHLLPG